VLANATSRTAFGNTGETRVSAGLLSIELYSWHGQTSHIVAREHQLEIIAAIMRKLVQAFTHGGRDAFASG
jgi:hypothetical protein